MLSPKPRSGDSSEWVLWYEERKQLNKLIAEAERLEDYGYKVTIKIDHELPPEPPRT